MYIYIYLSIYIYIYIIFIFTYSIISHAYRLSTIQTNSMLSFFYFYNDAYSCVMLLANSRSRRISLALLYRNAHVLRALSINSLVESGRCSYSVRVSSLPIPFFFLFFFLFFITLVLVSYRSTFFMFKMHDNSPFLR